MNNINEHYSVRSVNLAKKIEQPKNKENFVSDTKKEIVLPDIRSNQVLLPNNKIYTTAPKKLAQDFNNKNITIEIPEHYQKLAQKNIDTKNPLKIKKATNYINTKTGENISRITTDVYSEKGVLNSAEVMEFNTRNPIKATRYIKDFEHNRETEIKVTNPFNSRNMKNDSITTIYKDNKGNISKIVEYKDSVVSGIYDITETNAAGEKTIISKATKDENGNILVEKNLISLDGTKTEYRFESDEEGNHKKLYTQISDKDGNILSTVDRTYDKEGDITYSSINGHKYKAENKNEGIEITDFFKNEKTFIKIEDKLATDDEKFEQYQRRKAKGDEIYISNENVVEKIFNTLPADTILTLNKNIKTVIPLEEDLQSAFMRSRSFLFCKTDDFVINHELGHSMDSEKVYEITDSLEVKTRYNAPLSNNKQFQKVFIEEKAAFIKEFPDFEETFIDYFLHGGSTGNFFRGKEEVVAETNAINGLKPDTYGILETRTTLLQRYFPRSIAELSKVMTPIAIAE